MSLLEKTPGLLAALRGEMTPKFLATRSASGVPNAVPLISLRPAGDQPDLLCFGNFLLRKSIRNLKEDPRVAVLVMTTDLEGWALKGDFLGFERTGPYAEQQMSSSLLRYNAYTGVRNAGLIRILAVERAFRISRLQVAGEFALARLAALGGAGTGGKEKDGVAVPLAVRKEFGKMAAVKVLSWLGEDGYPVLIPALSLQPAGERALVCRRQGGGQQPAAGARVAANVLTPQAISYQAKGRWAEDGAIGRIQVEEVYAGGPPIPGGRVA